MNFAEIIDSWYGKFGRELPMRQTRDPYTIWLGEIIFQQTRVEQGLPYLRRFLERFPDIPALAVADQQEILKLWQGLGYYSRARNLHASAQYIYYDLGGIFPSDYKETLKLKGVGPYSAAAIASWCFGEAVAAVDGNVSRVLARIYGYEKEINTTSGKKDIGQLADDMLAQALESGFESGDHNQAMIDFGATMCTPSAPSCSSCPLKENCEARRLNLEGTIPRKKKKRKPRDRWFYYYLIHDGENLLLEKREGKDIWNALYQPPLLEKEEKANPDEISSTLLQQVLEKYSRPQNIVAEDGCAYLKHQLSHQSIQAFFTSVRVSDTRVFEGKELQSIPLSDLDKYPLPQLIHNYLESLNF